MIFVAVGFVAGLLGALTGLVVFGMVLAFFPAMTVFTAQSILAALFIVDDRPLRVPLLARGV